MLIKVCAAPCVQQQKGHNSGRDRKKSVVLKLLQVFSFREYLTGRAEDTEVIFLFSPVEMDCVSVCCT